MAHRKACPWYPLFRFLISHVLRVLPIMRQLKPSTQFNLAFCNALFATVGIPEREPVPTLRVCHQLVPLILSGFTLSFPKPNPQRPASTHTYIGSRESKKPRDNDIVGQQDLQSFHKFLLELNMYDEVDELLQKVAAESASVDTWYFESVLIPFLRHLIELVKKDDASANNVSYRKGSRSVLRQYIARVVQKKPHKDWARPQRGCGCGDCRVLDGFLLDPNAQTQRFSMAEPRRRHLQDKVRSYQGSWAHWDREDYTVTTDRGGSLHTLVITKTTNRFEKAHSDWKQRRDRTKQQIMSIAKPAELRLLLEGAYEELTDLSSATLPRIMAAAEAESSNRPALREPLAPLPHPIQTPAPISTSSAFGNGNGTATAQSMKRKDAPSGGDDAPSSKRTMVEVIDLSESP